MARETPIHDPACFLPRAVDGGGDAESSGTRRPWVLLSLGCGRPRFEITEFQRSQENAAHLAAMRGGLEARVVVAENDPDLQKRQIADAIALPEGTRPVAVLAYTVDVVGYEGVARAALAAGVGWVLVDSPMPLERLRADFPGRLIASVSADSEEVGRLSAHQALALLPDGGHALVIEGPSNTAAATGRLRGLEQGLRGSRLEVARTLVADWKTAGAEQEATAWLDRAGAAAGRPDLVISQNDEMAVGALQAFRARRPSWGKVPAIGIDGLPDYGQRLVAEGILSATILNPSPTGPSVDLVVRWLRGEEAGSVTLPVRPYPSLDELGPLRTAP